MRPDPGTGQDGADAGAEGTPRRPSLAEAASRLGAHAVGLVGTRVELAGVELAEARERLVASLLLLAAAFGCALMALMVATFGVIAWFWDTSRITAIVVVALVYVAAAALLWRRHRALDQAAPPIFGATVDALRRDVDALRGAPWDAPS